MKRLGIIVAATLVAGAARAEVADQGPAGFQIRHVVEIAAPPARVRAAALDIGKWWSSSHTYSGDAKNLSIDASGCFCETLPDGLVRHMSVVYSAPDALRMAGGLGPLATTGASGHLGLAFGKAADPDRTLLTLTYDVGGYARGGLAQTWAGPVDGVLGEQVARLKAHVETGKAP
ncbi:ATPase [Phenylobacterium sp.]|uniref:ATPase n=1 Tax=Phenylobacterium sp. TaxID=1871053 RepID=UPI0028A1874D|nr:ATPase [Phenylobacterium sp.]